MRVVRVSGGYLKIGRRGRPDQGLPPGEDPTDPDYGIDEGEPPQIEPPDPDDAPPGIWPPPTVGHPIVPVPPAGEGPGHLPEFPPGAIWPRPPGPAAGKFLVLCRVPGHGWKYIVVDPDAWPEPPAGGIGGTPPPRPGGPIPGR
jgi:hypothetical protein